MKLSQSRQNKWNFWEKLFQIRMQLFLFILTSIFNFHLFKVFWLPRIYAVISTINKYSHEAAHDVTILIHFFFSMIHFSRFTIFLHSIKISFKCKNWWRSTRMLPPIDVLKCPKISFHVPLLLNDTDTKIVFMTKKRDVKYPNWLSFDRNGNEKLPRRAMTNFSRSIFCCRLNFLITEIKRQRLSSSNCVCESWKCSKASKGKQLRQDKLQIAWELSMQCIAFRSKFSLDWAQY